MSGVALAWQQFRLERKLFWRNPTAAFFNFVLPLLMLVLIGSAFGSDAEDLDVLVPGIAGLGVFATTFTSLAYYITFLREEGILKRVRGTPIPTPSYLGGLLASVVANAAVQVTLVIVIGNLAYGVHWPEHPGALVGFSALGVICFGGLGIAFAHVIPNVDAGPAYVNAVFVPLIFISGVFYSADELPPVLEWIAQALPLKHLIDGLSYSIVGDGETGTALAVVGAWALAGLFLAVRYFRWE